MQHEDHHKKEDKHEDHHKKEYNHDNHSEEDKHVKHPEKSEDHHHLSPHKEPVEVLLDSSHNEKAADVHVLAHHEAPKMIKHNHSNEHSHVNSSEHSHVNSTESHGVLSTHDLASDQQLHHGHSKDSSLIEGHTHHQQEHQQQQQHHHVDGVEVSSLHKDANHLHNHGVLESSHTLSHHHHSEHSHVHATSANVEAPSTTNASDHHSGHSHPTSSSLLLSSSHHHSSSSSSSSSSSAEVIVASPPDLHHSHPFVSSISPHSSHQLHHHQLSSSSSSSSPPQVGEEGVSSSSSSSKVVKSTIEKERKSLETEAANLRELSSELRRELAELENDYALTAPVETGDVAVTLREVIENVKALLQDSHKKHMKVTQAIGKLRPSSSSKWNESSYAGKMMQAKTAGKVSPWKMIHSPNPITLPTRIPLEYVHDSPHSAVKTREHIEEEKKKLAASLQRVNDAKRAAHTSPKSSSDAKPGDRPPFSLSTMVDLPLSTSPRLPPPAFPASAINATFVSPSSLAKFRFREETTSSSFKTRESDHASSSSTRLADSSHVWNAAFSSSSGISVAATASSSSFSSPRFVSSTAKKPTRKTSPRTTTSPKTYTHTFSSGLKGKDVDAEGVSAVALLKRCGTDPQVALSQVARAQQRIVESMKFNRSTMMAPNSLSLPKSQSSSPRE